jgi:hypothetical protein
MERKIIYILIISIALLANCRPKTIPETRAGRKKADKFHKIQYEMHPTYKKKR